MLEAKDVGDKRSKKIAATCRKDTDHHDLGDAADKIDAGQSSFDDPNDDQRDQCEH